MGLKAKLKYAVNALRTERQVPIIQAVPEKKLLIGKTALITGGSGGIGGAIARRLSGAGAFVIVAGTNEGRLRSCAESLGERSSWVAIDLSDIESLSSKVDEAAGLSPCGQIDILVNSAGRIGHVKFPQVSEDEWDAVMDTNAKGMFFMSQAVARHMIERGVRGHILNVSSASALRPAETAYNVSKWAVRGMTLGMADSLAQYGIIVNAIGPGPTSTSMLNKGEGDSIEHATNPSGRYAMPEEIANLALFMVSGMGDMVVGDTFYITGGGGTVSMHR